VGFSPSGRTMRYSTEYVLVGPPGSFMRSQNGTGNFARHLLGMDDLRPANSRPPSPGQRSAGSAAENGGGPSRRVFPSGPSAPAGRGRPAVHSPVPRNLGHSSCAPQPCLAGPLQTLPTACLLNGDVLNDSVQEPRAPLGVEFRFSPYLSPARNGLDRPARAATRYSRSSSSRVCPLPRFQRQPPPGPRSALVDESQELPRRCADVPSIENCGRRTSRDASPKRDGMWCRRIPKSNRPNLAPVLRVFFRRAPRSGGRPPRPRLAIPVDVVG